MKNRLEAAPPADDCVNRDVNVRHHSPCSPAGVRCSCASTVGDATATALVATVTATTTRVSVGIRFSRGMSPRYAHRDLNAAHRRRHHAAAPG